MTDHCGCSKLLRVRPPSWNAPREYRTSRSARVRRWWYDYLARRDFEPPRPQRRVGFWTRRIGQYRTSRSARVGG
eukprot:706051-Rhodomonas_salina.3